MEKKTTLLAKDIIFHCRQKILSKFPFFSISLYFLKLEADEEITDLATDGLYLYFNSNYVLNQYKKNKNILYLGIIHTLMHCILRHFSKKNYTYYELYDVSMDITVYLMSVELGLITKKAKAQVLEAMPELKSILEKEGYKGSVALYNKALSDENLCHLLLNNATLFKLDSHVFWTKPKKRAEQSFLSGKPIDLDRIWQSIYKETETEILKVNLHGRIPGNFADLFLSEQVVESKISYQEYLRRLATLDEVMQLDMNSFDLIWYTTGLELYKDIPLIEFNEVKEEYVVNEFVLAIDTSASCSGKVMEDFLSQTIKIFQDLEIDKRRIKAKIIQCDTRIVREEDISTDVDIAEYTDNFKAYGFGGTDFNPVFTRIEELKDNGEFVNLKGLIYLSDGYGCFPDEKPEYETIFVLPPGEINTGQIPDWVTILQI